MNLDDLAAQIIQAVQEKPEAVKAISDALAAGDAEKIREAIHTHAGIQISEADAQKIASQVQAKPSQPAAYWT
ncbi:MAG: hypothetical protein R3F14_31150 [Polyangiaceae bacterium]